TVTECAGLTLCPFILIVVRRSASGTGRLKRPSSCSTASGGAVPQADEERAAAKARAHTILLRTVMSILRSGDCHASRDRRRGGRRAPACRERCPAGSTRRVLIGLIFWPANRDAGACRKTGRSLHGRQEPVQDVVHAFRIVELDPVAGRH